MSMQNSKKMEDTLYLQLRKLSGMVSNSENTVDELLETLWKTRKTGFRATDKSHFQSLLNLPSSQLLDPVLACLRSLIRKCARESFTMDDLKKLFPPDLPRDLQSILISSFNKHQNQWKEDVSTEQLALPRTNICDQVRSNILPSSTSVLTSETSLSSWSRLDNPKYGKNQNAHESSTHVMMINNAPGMDPLCRQPNACPPNDLRVLPHLKSMTWTMNKCSSNPANTVVVVTLKLHDSNSPSGETEVKFRLTIGKLEAMLKSITYIHEKLSNAAEASSCPPNKKQKQ